MKKVKLLLIVNIIQIVLLIGSIIAAVIILPNVMLFSNKDIPAVVVLGTDIDKQSGYAQVTSYGAVPNDGKDDTAAFKKALQTNASIYIPAGNYDIKETIDITDKSIKGCGAAKTVIRSSAKKNAISVSGNAVVEDLAIEFSEKTISGNEKSGERVAILDNGLSNGSMIRGVGFKNVGTGFLSNKDKGAFCTTIEAVTFENFSYKAIEIKNALSVVIRSATIGKSHSSKLVPVSLGGVVSVESISFNATECEYAIELKNTNSTYIKNVLFDNTTASKGFIKCDSALFTLQTVSVLGKNSECLISVNDQANKNLATDGSVLMVYSDCGDITVCKDGKITCDTLLK
ncbi:MAG: hypothetical protein J6A78_04810 [Clostridia bacterium]|nr:hypothetical protein [Clostridia bacterium]